MTQTIVALVLALFSALAGYGYGHEYGVAKVQAKWDTEKAAIIAAQREKEAELQASMDKLRETKNRETAKLQRTVAALTVSLRSRPERPTVPTPASVGDGAIGCTGTGLYKPDGNFLIGESARANILRLALITCQKAYQDAVDK